MASLQTALDAFIAPFPGRNPAGGLRRANRLSCRFVSLVFLRLTGAGACPVLDTGQAPAPVSRKNPARSSHQLVRYAG